MSEPLRIFSPLSMENNQFKTVITISIEPYVEHLAQSQSSQCAHICSDETEDEVHFMFMLCMMMKRLALKTSLFSEMSFIYAVFF